MLLCSRGVSRSGALCSSTLPAALRLISSKDIDVDALNQVGQLMRVVGAELAVLDALWRYTALSASAFGTQELDDVFGVQHASVVQHQWDGAPLPQRPPAVNKSSAARQAPSAQSTPPYQQARLSHDQSSTTSWSTTPHAQPLGSQPPLDQMVSGLSQQLAELRSHLAAVHTQLTQVRQQPPPPLQQHDTQHQYTPHASQAGPASCSAPSSPTDSASSPMDSTSWDDDSSNSSSSGYHQRHQDRPTGSLTHVDGSGRASMVDVSGKSGTTREARASCRVLLGPEAFDLVQVRWRGVCIYMLYTHIYTHIYIHAYILLMLPLRLKAAMWPFMQFVLVHGACAFEPLGVFSSHTH